MLISYFVVGVLLSIVYSFIYGVKGEKINQMLAFDHALQGVVVVALVWPIFFVVGFYVSVVKLGQRFNKEKV